MRRDVVAVIGPARVGKDSVFAALAGREDGKRYRRFAFADGVRRFLERQDPSNYPPGVDWEAAKQRPKVRRLLQETGMAGRAVDPTLWIRVLDEQMRQRLRWDEVRVITDARMHNEIAWLVDSQYALLVYLDRPDIEDADAGWRAHESEQQWRLHAHEAHLTFTGSDWTPDDVAAAIAEHVALPEYLTSDYDAH